MSWTLSWIVCFSWTYTIDCRQPLINNLWKIYQLTSGNCNSHGQTVPLPRLAKTLHHQGGHLRPQKIPLGSVHHSWLAPEVWQLEEGLGQPCAGVWCGRHPGSCACSRNDSKNILKLKNCFNTVLINTPTNFTPTIKGHGHYFWLLFLSLLTYPTTQKDILNKYNQKS